MSIFNVINFVLTVDAFEHVFMKGNSYTLLCYVTMFAADILPSSVLSVSMEGPKTSAAANARSECSS